MITRRDIFVERYPTRIHLLPTCVLLLTAELFYSFPRCIQEKTSIERPNEEITEAFSISPTNQFLSNTPPYYPDRIYQCGIR